MVAGLYWDWIVNRGRRDGQALGQDYLEVHFEDLISNPPSVLSRIGEFIDHDLDYERIRQVGIGSVSDPNSSFADKNSSKTFSPVGRWREKFPPNDLAMFEALVGRTMQDLGYQLATEDRNVLERSDMKRMRAMYLSYFDAKLYLKAKTPAGRLLVTRDLSWL
jgi:hypothetical protein